MNSLINLVGLVHESCMIWFIYHLGDKKRMMTIVRVVSYYLDSHPDDLPRVTHPMQWLD